MFWNSSSVVGSRITKPFPCVQTGGWVTCIARIFLEWCGKGFYISSCTVSPINSICTVCRAICLVAFLRDAFFLSLEESSDFLDSASKASILERMDDISLILR